MTFIKTTVVIMCVGVFVSHGASAKSKKKLKPVSINLEVTKEGIAFDQSRVEIPFSSEVVMKFENKAHPETEIQHNVAIIAPGKEKEVLDLMNSEDYDHSEDSNFFADPKRKALILAQTPILGPGDRKSVV